jgi:hypothetical protein
MNLIDKILFGAGAIVALVIAVIIVWLCLANAHLRADLAEARVNTTACRLANGDFRQQALRQDAAIAALRLEGAARAKRAAAASAVAEKTAAGFQADASRLAGQKAGGEDCRAATALLDHYIAGLK